MKAVTCDVILMGASTKLDGSLALRLTTPELRPDEKLTFLELQGKNLKMLLQPVEGDAVELKEVKGELNEKTPAQRLRATLFVLWKQQNEAIDFEVFYRSKMEGIIEHIKAKLNPE